MKVLIPLKSAASTSMLVNASMAVTEDKSSASAGISRARRLLSTAWNSGLMASSSSLSRTFGKTAPAPFCLSPATSSSASSPLSHHRAFIWCAILASSQATPGFAQK